MTKTAIRLCAVVGMFWIGLGLRDLFAPHLFRFDGQVTTSSTLVLDFAAGVAFLACAFCFHHTRPTTAR